MSNDDVPSLTEQDEEGVYFEEVEQIVDGIVDRIKSGELTSKDGCQEPLEQAVHDASHTNSDDLCVRVLKWSKYPTAYFFNNGWSSGTDPDFMAARLHEEPSAHALLPWHGGRRAFPWRRLACPAMEEDVQKELVGRPEFEALPQYSEEDDDAAEEDDEPEEEAGTEEAGG